MRKYPITLHVYSYVTLEKVIKGVEDLLDYYEHPRATRFNCGSCPLCNFFECAGCLWAIFHHKECEDFAIKMFDEDVGELKKNKRWRAFRRKELKSWLQELKRPGVKIIEDA